MVDRTDQETKLGFFNYLFVISLIFLFFSASVFAQENVPMAPTPSVPVTDAPAAPATNSSTNNSTSVPATPNNNDGFSIVTEGDKEPVSLLAEASPNKRRIRRHLSLIRGVKVDEELLIPNVPLKILPLGQDLINIVRIKDSDIFRIEPLSAKSGIVTLHNKKTGQIYAELHLDVRDSGVDKTIRDLKALLSDIEGVEYKAVNGGVVLDGFVLLPQDLLRVNNVVNTYKQGVPDGAPAVKINSLVTLSPIARKRIIEYISREINNPEVTVSSVGDYIKLEGSVNSDEEKRRIVDLVSVYLPSYVSNIPVAPLSNVNIMERKLSGDAASMILNLITVRKQEEKEEPPPKMIQVVFHFVEFSERYLKGFQFDFSPVVSTGAALQMNAAQQVGGQNSIDSIAGLVNNLLPKINWAKTHGFLRVLDTGSVLVQDGQPGSISRGANTNSQGVAAAGAAQQAPQENAGAVINIAVTPQITQPRSGLISLDINVVNRPSGGSIASDTNVKTKIVVRDRQSAAFGGIINKATNNDYGIPPKANSLFTLSAGKKYTKNSGNFVVFVTPIIKTSASAGVEQVKKKFRLKE